MVSNCCQSLQVFDPNEPTCLALVEIVSETSGEIVHYKVCGLNLYKEGILCECSSCNLPCGDPPLLCSGCDEATCELCLNEPGASPFYEENRICLHCQDLLSANREVDSSKKLRKVQVREAHLEHFKGRFPEISRRLIESAKLGQARYYSEEEKTASPKLRGTQLP